MKDIFYEIVDEAKDGYVTIDGEKWPISFNTFIYKDGKLTKMCSNDRNLSALVVKDENKFFKLLDEYLELEISKKRKCINFYGNDREYKKFLISYLMVNASTEDFMNPMEYLRRTISFFNDDTFDEFSDGYNFELNGLLGDCKLRVKDSGQGVMMETPRKLELSIVKEGKDGLLEYKLPSISYGVDGDVCYIYSLLNPKDKTDMNDEERKFSKKIWRLLYKINNGVESTEDELSDITKVSPSAVLSLVVFLSLLKNKEISDVRAVPYLPLRYLSRDIMANEQSGERREKLLERNEMIQKNVTDKFIRTFMRAAYHMEDSEVTLFPYEVDECLHFKIGKSNNIDNQMLNETAESVSRGK